MKHKRRKPLSLLVSVAALAIVMAIAAVEPALAKPSDIGENIGSEVGTWAKSIVIALAALLGIPALAKRNIGEAFTLLVVLVIVGMFAFAPSETKTVIKGLAGAISGA